MTGLFAEENEFERRALWRIGTWGVAAVGAVVLAVTSNQWSIGIKRNQLAAADLSQQARQIQSVAKESQNETRRLAAAIDTLNNDRDRLFSRITVLEQGLDSVTGTIVKQSAAASANAAPKPPPSVAAPPATLMPPSAQSADNPPKPASPPNQAATPAMAPAVPVATNVAPAFDKPRADAGKPNPAPGAIASLRQIAAIKPAVPLAPAADPSPVFAPPLSATKSMIGPPDPAAPRLVEAANTEMTRPDATRPEAAKADTAKTANAAPATAPAPTPPLSAAAEVAATAPDAKAEDKDQEQAPSDAEASKIQRTEFAVELGGANSIAGLRALWRGLLKSNNADLAELRPVIVLREGNTGLGMELRLAAGPLQNAAEAARICASLSESKRTCETTVFDGQRLAMGADEQPAPNGKQLPASAKPSSYQHYYASRHAKKEDPQPPPKQDSSTFSLFGPNKH